MAQSEGPPLREADATFSGDAQILSELGERLIVDPNTALSELIKNSFDADATEVYLWLEGGASPKLHIQDNGTGMNEREFLSGWMRIGTTSKLGSDASRIFKRPLTGSKGVGRFAVRRLGLTLNLDTTADSGEAGKRLRLSSDFDWAKFKPGRELKDIKVHYRILSPRPDNASYTHLSIGKLADDWDSARLARVTNQVLDVVTPAIPEWLARASSSTEEDPGLRVYFGEPGSGTELQTATSEIVDRWLARVRFSSKGGKLTYRVTYRNPETQETRFSSKWTATIPKLEALIGPLQGEIGFYPHRSGVFSGLTTADGRRAHAYLQEQGGVRLVDRGIRVKPYGEPEDDWLYLSGRMARNLRRWVSPVTDELLADSTFETDGRYSPYLRVPANHQVLGWVSIETFRERSTVGAVQIDRIQPSMDRQGLVQNEGFRLLRQLVITAVELLAVVDARGVQEIDREEAETEAKDFRESLAAAALRVQRSRDIVPSEKTVVLAAFRELAERYTRTDEARSKALAAVESASLLGVLASFMTHETKTLMTSLRDSVSALKRAESDGRAAAMEKARTSVEDSIYRLRSFMDYSQTFLHRLPDVGPEPFSPYDLVEHVVGLFSDIATKRRIQSENKVEEGMRPPKVWGGLYSAVVLNLYTNALKALMHSKEDGTRVIRIEARNTEGEHILRVADTGPGIPPEIKDYIFDPFVSTTRELAGPLAGGLGLGLFIVKRAVTAVGGKIRVAAPPEGFVTAFEVAFPL